MVRTTLPQVSFVALALVFSAVTLRAQQATPDFSGTWTAPIQNGAATGTLTLTQQQAAVKGTYKRSDAPEVATVEGRVRPDGALEARMVLATGDTLKIEGRLGEGPSLAMKLFLPDGQPRDLVFRRAPAGGAANPLGGAPANPLGGAPQNPLGGPAPPAWAGTWSDGTIKLAAEPAAGGGFQGTLTAQATPYPAKGTERGGKLEGTFNVQGHDYAFTAVLEGDVLSLTSDGTTYRLRKEGAAAPAPGPGPGPGPAPPKPAGQDGGGLTGTFQGATQPYQHASGTSFDMPQGCMLQGDQEGLLLIATPSGEGSAILVSQAELDPDEVDQSIQELMVDVGPDVFESFQINPTANAAQPRVFTLNGAPAAESTWSGRAQTGAQVTLWAGGFVHQGRGIVVIALGPEGQEQSFVPHAKRILTTLKPGK